MASLPKWAIIYSAEISGIKMAISIIKGENVALTMIFTDSYNVLRALNIRNHHPYIRSLFYDLNIND